MRILTIFLLLSTPQAAGFSGEDVPPCLPVQFDYSQICDVPGINEMVRDAAQEFGVDADLLIAHAMKESDCRPSVTGDGGDALGMAQVHPRWWRAKLKKAGLIEKDEDLYNAETAMRALAWISKHHQSRSKSLHDSVRRYNGSGARARAYADDILDRRGRIAAQRELVESQCQEVSF